MFRRMASWVLPLVVFLGLGSGTASATTPVIPPGVILPTTSIFDFTGQCSDCNFDAVTSTFGVATAELTLSNYTSGDYITLDNFVSFHYDGTDLQKGFTIDRSNVTSVNGSIDGPLPASESFEVMSGTFGDNTFMVFDSSSRGPWCVGGSCDADFGSTHAYSMTAVVLPPPGTSVPEPMPVALLAGGLVAAIVARRKRA